MCTENHVLVKNVYKEACNYDSELKRQSMEGKYTGKEKVLGTTISKEGYADSVLGQKRTYLVHSISFQTVLYRHLKLS